MTKPLNLSDFRRDENTLVHKSILEERRGNFSRVVFIEMKKKKTVKFHDDEMTMKISFIFHRVPVHIETYF